MDPPLTLLTEPSDEKHLPVGDELESVIVCFAGFKDYSQHVLGASADDFDAGQR
jgi:hypothetical protein